MFDEKSGKALLETLKEWDIDSMYGMPGDSVNSLMEVLRKDEVNMNFVSIRHEETGALAASAYAKATGKIGVCLSIGGPGAIHLMNGLYDAREDRVPVLAIVGQVPRDKLGLDSFQEINLERMLDDVTVFNHRVGSADSLPDLVNNAIRTAIEKKGVAALIIPDDITKIKIEGDTKFTSSIQAKSVAHPHEEDMQKAAAKISKAKRPVILAGKGASHARDELLEFADKAAAPIVVSLPAKGVIPDENPFNLGQLGQIGTKPAFEAMEETDLLIMAGTSFPYRDYLPEDAPAIQIDIDPVEISKRYPISVGLIGDAKWTLKELESQINRNEDRDFLEKCQENMKNWFNHIGKEENEKSYPIKPQQIMPTMQKYIEDDAVVSVDVGNIIVWAARHLRLTNQKFIISSWLATMGFGLPGAIASKIAYPDKQVVAICGDGGFSMVMHDFMTAVKYKLPMMVVIFNNERLGMIKYEQQAIGNIDYETELEDFNYARFAETAGGVGYRVEKHEDLEEAFRQASQADRPAIIDVMIEEQPPLPGKVTYTQAKGYSKYMFKNLFEKHSVEMPPLKQALKRMF